MRRVIASREFAAGVPAAAKDHYESVVAANRAVQPALEDLDAFWAEAASGWNDDQ